MCLICHKKTKDKLCSKCSKEYLYDSKIKMIRRKKYFNTTHDSANELRLHNVICELYGRKHVFKHVHPLWAISSKGVLLEYDVAVPSEKLLIEYDGRQHFEYPNFFHRSKKQFLLQVRRDKKKNRLAKKNGFKLVRFNYKENIDNVSIERKLKLC